MAICQAYREESKESKEAKVTSYFDVAFTANSNRLMDTVYTDPDVPPSVRLLLFIARFSTGYLKPEVVLTESFILKTAKMSRSSIYKAKKELIEAGKITVTYTLTGNCIYRLTPDFQCLKGATSPTAADQDPPPSVMADGGGLQPRTPHVYKEIQENINHHQQTPNDKANHNTNATDDEFLTGVKENKTINPSQIPHSHHVIAPAASAAGLEVIVTEAPPTAEAVQSVKANKIPKYQRPALGALTANQQNLALRLRKYALTWRIAESLVRNHPADIVERALESVRVRKEIINPAGWLVREIQSGGYAPPQAIVAEQNRQAVEKARAAEKATVEAERERLNRTANADLAELESLSPERQTELLEAARKRMAWAPKAATAAPDNPFIRSIMLDLLREARSQTGQVASGFDTAHCRKLE